MKRKLLTLLISLAMVVTMMPMTAVGSFAASTSPFTKAQLEEPFYIEAVEDGMQITLLSDKGKAPDVCVLYSTDEGKTWKEISFDDGSLTLSTAGDRAYFKAGTLANPGYRNKQFGEMWYYNSIRIIGKANIGGNIMSLLDGQNFSTMTSFEKDSDSIFMGLFSTSNGIQNGIVSAGKLVLPVMELVPSCYKDMFGSCTLLEEVPALPATKMAEKCYSGMFGLCKSLTKAPELPAKELARNCYEGMFSNCNALITPPELPATKLADSCYTRMFDFCSSLKKTPEFPAKELKPFCYDAMFRECENLEEAADLPATKLEEFCYEAMFSNCKSLKEAPKLPAAKLAYNCYCGMFQSCTALEKVEVGFTEWDTSALSGWISAVADEGVFICKQELADDIEMQSISNIEWGIVPPKGWTIKTTYYNQDELIENLSDSKAIESSISEVVDRVRTAIKKIAKRLPFVSDFLESAEDEPMYIETQKGGTTVKLLNENWGELPEVHLICKVNNGQWQDFDFEKGVTLTNAGDRVYFKAGTLQNKNLTNNQFALIYDMRLFYGLNSHNTFSIDGGTAKVGGNIMSLLDGNNFSTMTSFTTENEGAFAGLFQNNDSIISAEDLILPATKLVAGCYMSMFENCHNLLDAPKLPAKNLKQCCYFKMFSECTSLSEAPELPATKLSTACYALMFSGCAALKKAPQLPAEEVPQGGYMAMFNGCVDIQEVELPAKTINTFSYTQIFAGCSSLKTVKLGLTEWRVRDTEGWLNSVENCKVICTPELLESIKELEAEGAFESGTEYPIPESGEIASGYTEQVDRDLKDDLWTIITFPARMFSIVEVAKVAIKTVGLKSFFDGLISGE